MYIKENLGRKIFNLLNVIILFITCILAVYPMLYILFASISNPTNLVMHSGLLFKPLGFYLGGYSMVLQNKLILSGYINTIFIVVVGVSLNIFLTSLGAYFLSQKGVMLQKYVMIFIVITMYFNGGLIPYYLTVKGLGLRESLFSLIFPVAINTFNLIIMRTAFMGIPDSVQESARIDGARHWTILFRIILPLSKATVAVLILYYGVYHWNAWFNSLLFITRKQMYPLQMVLHDIILQNQTADMASSIDAGGQEAVGQVIKYAVIIVATVPILSLYPFLQKHFTKGLLIGAVKG